MKKEFATFLLLCYALVLFKPVLPVLADAFAHVFMEERHMATVHFENGRYHLHLEVKAASENLPDQKSTTMQAGETSAVHLKTHTEITIPEATIGAIIRIPVVNVKPVAAFKEVPAPPPWNS
jgi:hypothetical protein